MSESLYPQVKVRLVGEGGNAFSIMVRAAKAAKRAGIDADIIDQYRQEAMSGDYNNLLRTTMRYFDCDGSDDDDDYS